MAVLHRKSVNETEELAEIDQAIQNYIEKNPRHTYEQILTADNRWEVFFHLSELRSSLLNWYEFKEDAELLEIGGGFGALTGLFCERCAQVTTIEDSAFRAEAICRRYADVDNLEVYAGMIEDVTFTKKFDYISLIGGLEYQGSGSKNKEPYAVYLQRISQLLKPDGKLLLAVENRYGIRYFCGAEEPHTKKPFDGITGYPNGTKGYSFSKQELTDILQLAGLAEHKFYYPLPDYKLPQIIYSEQYLPQNNLRERLIPYYTNKDTLLAYETDLYDDIVANQVFEFFANSFLVECTFDKQFSSVVYAAMSTDRGQENAFATTIHENDIVKKIPLYKQGEVSAKKLYDNMQDLKAHNVPVILHHLDNHVLMMPYVKSMTLSNYLKEVVKTDQEKFVQIFDRLYACILASSAYVAPESNALCNAENQDLDWGIILSKAYIELIPLNCFYEGEEFIFFDQEFVRECYPAKYVLFRALHYMYAFAPYAEQFVPLQTLKEKYKLEELWNIFVAEETKFLREIRNHKLYQQFYAWASVDKNRMRQNTDLLGSNDEVMAEYKVSAKMKKIWDVQLNLLKVFKEVCERNHLKYFMIYGTLLGAVRHKGFIPWDDDVDLVMPRADFDKLKEIARQEFQEPYFFQTPENDPNCFYNGYCRLRDSRTTGIGVMDVGHECHRGIWIDILPLDPCVRDEAKLKKKTEKIHFYQNLLYEKVYGEEYQNFGANSVVKAKVYAFLAKILSHQFLCKKLDQAFHSYTDIETDYLAIFTHFGKYQPFDKRDFESSVLLDFHELNLPAPFGYQRCLEMSMGRDYMKYPPEEKRKPHHRGIFNPEVSYLEYDELFFHLFSDIEGKEIILFGAGLMFEDYMKKHGDMYAPSFIVDNDKAKWGTRKQGITVKGAEAILQIPPEKRRLIICSAYYREIEKQLKEMGIEGYKIYIQEKDWIVTDEEKGR